MPEETQLLPPSISQPLGKHKRNWKKILLILFIIGILVSLIGVGVYFIGTGDFQAPSSQKQATPSAKKQTSNKKGVLYLRFSDQKVNLPFPGLLGDLWVYDLGNKKKFQITNDGRVANYPIKLSPNGKKIAYRKNMGDMESVWIYDFQTKKEKKLTEFTATVSDSEYSRIDDIVWKDNSKEVAYLVRNRPTDDDPRMILKATIHINDLSTDTKSIDAPLTGLSNLLVWLGNKIIASTGTGDGGVSKITFINIDNEKLKDRSELLEKNVDKGLASVSGSPESKRIAIDDSDSSVVIDVSTDKEIFNLKLKTTSLVGWTNSGSAIYIDYSSNENGKGKLSIYNFQTKQFKFTLFADELLRNAFPVTGFSDLSAVLTAELDFDSNMWNYYVLNMDGTKEVKLPIATKSSQGRVTTVPIENF